VEVNCSKDGPSAELANNLVTLQQTPVAEGGTEFGSGEGKHSQPRMGWEQQTKLQAEAPWQGLVLDSSARPFTRRPANFHNSSGDLGYIPWLLSGEWSMAMPRPGLTNMDGADSASYQSSCSPVPL
jgi:hypothetical protein